MPVQKVSVCTLIPQLPMINTSKKHPLCGAFQNPNPPNKSPNIFHKPTNPNPRVAMPSRCPRCPLLFISQPSRSPSDPLSLLTQPALFYCIRGNQSTPHQIQRFLVVAAPLFGATKVPYPCPLPFLRPPTSRRGGGGKGAPSRSPSSLTIHN